MVNSYVKLCIVLVLQKGVHVNLPTVLRNMHAFETRGEKSLVSPLATTLTACMYTVGDPSAHHS